MSSAEGKSRWASFRKRCGAESSLTVKNLRQVLLCLLAVIRTVVVLVLTAHVILYVGLRQNKRRIKEATKERGYSGSVKQWL